MQTQTFGIIVIFFLSEIPKEIAPTIVVGLLDINIKT